MTILKKCGRYLLWWIVVGGLGGLLISTSAFLYLSPKLPPADSYRNIRLEYPLRIYTADDKLIAEIGTQKRDPVKYQELPPLLVSALIASEDSRFYEHHGVDLKALARSVVGIITGDSSGGGSTITMQVAKNISFEGEDPYSRKFKEILLALQIERELSKEDIIELYLNRIFFGISAYGVSAAATQYYNKPLDELTLAEMAMTIAILPAPNSYNPLNSPERAVNFRSRVLRRMHEFKMISQEQYVEADNAPITAQRYGRQPEVRAPYIAEMVRLDMIERFGELALTDGYSVYTTLDSEMQEIANTALENGLETYDRRHGYRGRENQMLPGNDDPTENWLNILTRTSTVASQQPAFVQAVDERSITALLKTGESIVIEWDGIRWAKRFINTSTWQRSPRAAQEVASVGDLIRVTTDSDGNWMIGQIPAVNGGLVSMDPNNGGIRALVGGYDYNNNKFNRITQAERQPGSNFKPFLYSAALENGYTAATRLNDSPLARDDYRPQNYSGEFIGYIRLKYALTMSKNVVSERLFETLGSDTVYSYISRFGFNSNEFPTNDLTVAIGSHAVKPIEMVTAYSTFANGGYKVEPFYISHINNFNDGQVFQAQPYTVCSNCDLVSTINGPIDELPIADTSDEDSAESILALLQAELNTDDNLIESSLETGQIGDEALLADTILAEVLPTIPAPRVINKEVAYIMNTFLRSVITSGSGRRANREINRQDLAGKTGTTNGATDLWFSGFNGSLVTTVYVGFDQPQTLGDEEASTVALPIWIEFMKSVLEGQPENFMAQPDGLVNVRISSETGLRARANEEGAIFEVFRAENVPDYPNGGEEQGNPDNNNGSPSDNIF